jgi:hypothetical protein
VLGQKSQATFFFTEGDEFGKSGFVSPEIAGAIVFVGLEIVVERVFIALEIVMESGFMGFKIAVGSVFSVFVRFSIFTGFVVAVEGAASVLCTSMCMFTPN